MRSRMMVPLALATLVAAAATVPAVAGVRAGLPERPATVTGATARVRIVDLAFRPRRVEVSRGTRVRWTNRGALSHTTTSRTDVWDSGTLASGDSFSRVFRSSGTFRYICSIHPDMRGKVVVT